MKSRTLVLLSVFGLLVAFMGCGSGFSFQFRERLKAAVQNALDNFDELSLANLLQRKGEASVQSLLSLVKASKEGKEIAEKLYPILRISNKGAFWGLVTDIYQFHCNEADLNQVMHQIYSYALDLGILEGGGVVVDEGRVGQVLAEFAIFLVVTKLKLELKCSGSLVRKSMASCIYNGLSEHIFKSMHFNRDGQLLLDEPQSFSSDEQFKGIADEIVECALSL